MLSSRLLLSLIPACFLLTAAVAKPVAKPAEAPADSAAAAVIKRTLESRFPGTPIVSVTPSPIPGLYEVFTGETLVYSDKTGDHVFNGQFIDTATRTDITAQRLEAHGRIDFDSLPFERAIKVVKGDGSRKIAVFADPDCPYCQKLEEQMAVLDNLTVYTFLFPLSEIHPDATNKARAIWCAGDRSQVWEQWMVKQKAIPPASCAGDPVAELRTLAKKLYISTTPTFFLDSGRRVRGAMDAAQLAKLLDENKKGSPQSPGG
ncbi:MAG: DsbC family protein [Gammaproteobacteria bacterium]